MTRLSWASPSQRTYETGVDRGVLFPQESPGVPWVGLKSVVEKPSGGEVERAYLDGRQIYQRQSGESFDFTMEAFTYPDEFLQYDGFSESVSNGTFNLAYRTLVGNFEVGNEYGYKLHLIYGAVARPSDKSYFSNDSGSETTAFSWDLSTTPTPLTGYRASSHFIIDTTVAWREATEQVEAILYGTSTTTPRMPSPSEVIAIFDEFTRLRIIDHGDGTWTAVSEDMIQMTSPTSFQITSPTAVFLDADTYTVSNY